MYHLPLSELESRWRHCRTFLQEQLPEAEGLLVFSRLNIYYLSGTFASGLLWLPLAGKPVLLCRRGLARANQESPLPEIFPFKSYGDVQGILHEAGSPLAPVIAAEMNGLSWALAASLTRHLGAVQFLAGDPVLAMARAVKSGWELQKVKAAGERHARCLRQGLPSLLRQGMNEREIALALWQVLFAEGHQGLLRMENYGEEAFLGHIAVGENANYPSVFNGPVGLRGEHPAIPHMGSPETVWRRGQLLICDCGFMLEGYQTDKTQVYWLGERSEIPAKVQAAHDFCLEMQEWVQNHLKPGVLPSEIWAHCSKWAENAGWGEGFMALGGNKVHFIGHGIGLAIDEYPVLAPGFDKPLASGMVLAVEPKLGLPGLGMVGVENTFEVTPAGGKSLTGGEGDILCL
jgi:Xaa-Pro dipeptidase